MGRIVQQPNSGLGGNDHPGVDSDSDDAEFVDAEEPNDRRFSVAAAMGRSRWQAAGKTVTTEVKVVDHWQQQTSSPRTIKEEETMAKSEEDSSADFHDTVVPTDEAELELRKGDTVLYGDGEACEVIEVHREDVKPYFTIRMPDGREKQTTKEKLSSRSPLATYITATPAAATPRRPPTPPSPRKRPPTPPSPQGRPSTTAQPIQHSGEAGTVKAGPPSEATAAQSSSGGAELASNTARGGTVEVRIVDGLWEDSTSDDANADSTTRVPSIALSPRVKQSRKQNKKHFSNSELTESLLSDCPDDSDADKEPPVTATGCCRNCAVS